jgi:hypothetical protein
MSLPLKNTCALMGPPRRGVNETGFILDLNAYSLASRVRPLNVSISREDMTAVGLR